MLTNGAQQQGSRHFKQTKFPDLPLMNFQHSRIIISSYFPFETIFDALAESSSCSEHGEIKDSSMYTGTFYNTGVNGFPSLIQHSFAHHVPLRT